jgi:hypothetical protein
MRPALWGHHAGVVTGVSVAQLRQRRPAVGHDEQVNLSPGSGELVATIAGHLEIDWQLLILSNAWAELP